MSKLNGYKDEIITLLDDGMSQAQIIRHFAERGVKIPRSSLSDFVRQRQDHQATVATMQDDGLAERFAAALDFQRATTDTLVDRMVDVTGELQRLQRESEERHSAVVDAINSIEVTPVSTAEDIRPLLDDALSRIDDLSARTGGAGLRWIWGKALLFTGLAWGLVVTALHYIPGMLAIAYLTFLMD